MTEKHNFEQFEHSDFMVCLKCSLLVDQGKILNGKIIGDQKVGEYLSNGFNREYQSAGCRTW